ncbi:hypothetical protein BaRGS_00027938, partial [Batillaria attramentaria]
LGSDLHGGLKELPGKFSQETAPETYTQNKHDLPVGDIRMRTVQPTHAGLLFILASPRVNTTLTNAP